MNYLQLEEKFHAGVDFEHARSDFLHAFFEHRDAVFFEYPREGLREQVQVSLSILLDPHGL
ncbi:hypothetical protein [Edaphobacter bradus]|uniref:hypothetical protein n=1 Tax=Edaphobacter bradus TaxID=2259016 RepID=UPI0021DF9A95|nr:hypothetical protein [Edaphobacter bradus]